ncbi:MAG: DUF1080 domain-containing protein [Bryobacteraceae bacterium]|nr:DUF1080 domain-containing protein [Bryobacteraceae bacterium]
MIAVALLLLLLQAKPPGEDWKPLFNGKDLSGWVEIGKERWSVAEGVLHGQAVSEEYGYLMTARKYRDFHLSLRFQCIGNGNSGLFFRAAFKPGTADVTQGPQFEIDCAIGRHTGGIYDVGRQWLVWPAPENETVVRAGEWNELLVKVEGNRYVSRLNGVLMVDFTDPKPQAKEGGIALQLHSGGRGDMKFKDIWIRDLTER